MNPLDGIAVFMAVARHGSFSAAAESLGCSKSTVSDQITRLEGRIGARLLRRSTRSVSLTEAGRAYLCQVDDLLDRVRDAERAARAEATEPRGVLRVSAPAPFAAIHIAPLLPEFMTLHPDVRIDLHVTAEVVDLVTDGFDLAIRLCSTVEETMIARRLGGTRIIAAAAPKLLNGRPQPASPEDLADWPLIVNAAYPDRTVYRLFKDGEERTAPARPLVTTTCPEVLRRLVLAGAGVGLFCECVIADDLARGDLVRLLPDWCVVEDVPILAVYPDNRMIAAKVRTFVDFLARRLPSAPMDRPADPMPRVVAG